MRGEWTTGGSEVMRQQVGERGMDDRWVGGDEATGVRCKTRSY